MADHWDNYFCKVNDKLASIFVNLGMRESAPDSTRPHLLWVWIYFKSPRADGLNSHDEFDAFCSIEDSLVPIVEKKCNAIMPGRITTGGRREFYFYASEASKLQDAVDIAMASFGNYRYWVGHKSDPTWSHYLNVLYPSEIQQQKMGNRKVLDSLEQEGDKLEKPRDVVHWVYFKAAADRENYKNAILNLAYSIEEESQVKENQKYCLRFKRCQMVSSTEIDDAVIELFQLAKKHRGEYDGWETEVITPNLGPVQ